MRPHVRGQAGQSHPPGSRSREAGTAALSVHRVRLGLRGAGGFQARAGLAPLTQEALPAAPRPG